MTNSTIDVSDAYSQPDEAAWISNRWDKWDGQRQGWKQNMAELDKYLYATDTTTTTNNSLPWKNSTTLPKLTQIMDNLHSNYISSIFPNDKWLLWEAHDSDSAKKQKVKNITAYMENKTRLGGFRQKVSQLLLDYIKGNCFSTISFEKRHHLYEDTDSIIPTFIGPKAVRINPFDIVFNPTVANFEDSPKIIRSLKSIGELLSIAESNPEQMFWKDVVEDHLTKGAVINGAKQDENEKRDQYMVDGFGSLDEYYNGEMIEILEFYGDYYDRVSGELHKNRMITVAGRSYVARNIPITTYGGQAPIFHSSWRTRPDNLWGMGPLENLVGMQYRIDHLENLKADAMDLIVHPPLKVIGEVEEFQWGPNAIIHIDENGDVQEVAKSLNAIVIADNQIAELEERMELYAGAPREAMGVRSPGEKTKFEVSTLQNAAGRIFQEKTTHFEITTLEPLLNAMFEISVRNFDGSDVVSVLDKDLGSTEFLNLTAADITAKGIIRPIGARHFAQQAQDLQNLLGLTASPIWAKIEPHTSSIALTEYINDSLSITAYNLFRPHVGIMEAQEIQSMMNQAQEDLEVEATAPTAPETVPQEGQQGELPV